MDAALQIVFFATWATSVLLLLAGVIGMILSARDE
jgi:hypothetical protein